MTDVEHYVENAISFLEAGGEYEEFFKMQAIYMTTATNAFG